MDVVLVPLLRMVITVLELYVWVIVIGVILSWLVAFNVINRSNRFVYMVADFIYRITEPALRPIRNLLPNLGNFDISPIVLILLIVFVVEMLARLMVRIA